MNDNSRIRLTIILSAIDFPYQQVLAYLVPRLGKAFAGATCQPVDGIWSPDGFLDKQLYQSGEYEPGIQICLSVLPNEETRALNLVKSLVSELKTELSLSIHWVHVEIETIVAAHFSLDE